MPSVLSKNVTSRALWTGAQVGIALAVTLLPGISAWWAAPIAVLLSAVKTNVVDAHFAPKPQAVTPAPAEETGP